MGTRSKPDVAWFNRVGEGHLPAHLGVVIDEVGDGYLRSHLEVQPYHMAPNGFLHAASVLALADTSAGYACVAHLPQGAESFTTLELKANFLGTVREGRIDCEVKAAHLGRTTQLWEARVTDPRKKRLLATFACTQMLLAKRT